MPTKIQHPENRVETLTTPAKVSTGGAGIVALAGVAGIVLGILGLATIVPVSLDGIAVLVLGGGLILGGALFSAVLRPMPGMDTSNRQMVSGNFTTEILLGLAAVVLGIFALASSVAINLIAIGVIALGIALWAGSAGEARLGLAISGGSEVRRKAASGLAALGIVVGVGAIVLGILALFQVIPRVLTLISVIGVGAALLAVGIAAARGTSWSASQERTPW